MWRSAIDFGFHRAPAMPRHPSFMPTVEDWAALDVRRLHRRGLLHPGRSGVVQWSWRGEPAGAVAVHAGADGLTLSYRTRAPGDGPGQEVEQGVALAATPCHYGGRRLWFLRPRCGRRCAVLHGGVSFYCRRCWSLPYRSQREDAADRAPPGAGDPAPAGRRRQPAGAVPGQARGGVVADLRTAAGRGRAERAGEPRGDGALAGAP
jgi:hypothetical protein